MLSVVSQILLYLFAAALLGFGVGYLYRRQQTAADSAAAELEAQIRNESRDQELQSLRRDAEMKKTAVEALQTKLDSAEVKRLGLEGTVAEREARIRELRGELAANQAGAEKEVDALRARLKEAHDEQKARAKNTGDLEAAAAKARSAFEARDKEAAELRARLSESEALQKDLRAQAARLRDLERKGIEAQQHGQSRELQSDDARLQELESRFQHQLDTKTAELDRLRRRILELEGGD